MLEEAAFFDKASSRSAVSGAPAAALAEWIIPMATLETNGSFPELTIAEYEAFDRIVYSVGQQKWTVSLIITDGGTLDLSDELAFTPAEISTSAESTTLVSGTGNDWLYGNIGDDAVSGNDGRDYIFGDAGDDTLWGDAGNDYLDGGTGANVLYGGQGDDSLRSDFGNSSLIGGTGNDVYYSDGDDVIVELVGEGIDTIVSLQHIPLPHGIENLTVISTVDGTLRGDPSANVLRGGNGNETLNGGNGLDTLYGSSGNDTYILNDPDRVSESSGGGIDTVRVRMSYTLTGEVENLVLTGTDDISATGNRKGNVITGNAGDNLIDGSLQTDILTGKDGADSFIFSATPGPPNTDTITDFDPTQDRILLDRDVFRSMSLGSLAPSAFAVIKGGEAADGQDRIIYDKTTGKLYYDPDGWNAKEGQVFAIVDPGLALSANDFLII